MRVLTFVAIQHKLNDDAGKWRKPNMVVRVQHQCYRGAERSVSFVASSTRVACTELIPRLGALKPLRLLNRSLFIEQLSVSVDESFIGFVVNVLEPTCSLRYS